MRFLLLLILFLSISKISFSQVGIISTIAGGGTRDCDTCMALIARLEAPYCSIIDSNGNIYFCEHYRCLVRKLDTNGLLTTIAGDWRSRYAGDGGLAIRASFKEVIGLCFDWDGHLLAVDAQANRIRKINFATGIINTVFGSGASVDSGDGGPASSAGIFGPFSIIRDYRGDYLIAQTGTNKVHKVSFTTGIISRIAGIGTTGSYGGDGGPATAALFHRCRGLSMNENGIYIADQSNNRVRKIDTNGIISTIAGTGGYLFNGDSIPATNANTKPFQTLMTPNGELIIGDGYYGRIRKIGLNDTIYTIAGSDTTGFSGDGGPATAARLGRQITGLAQDACGNLIFTDYENYRVRKITYPYGNQPTITISQNDTQIPCYSLPVSFTASTRLAGRAPTYQWQVNGVNRGTSSPTFSYLPTHGDVVRCILRSNLYCVINPYDTSNEIHVVVDSLTPPVLTIGGPSTATLSSTVPLSTTISGGSFSSYNLQWRNLGSLVATTTTPSYSYTKGPGTDSFTVTLTSIDRGCYDSATSAIHTVSLPVGFNNTTSSSNTWEVYPNPAHQKLFIANKQLILGKLTLFNALGTEVYTTQSTGHQAVIDISALPVGVYTLQAKGGGEVFVTKFTKE